MSDAIAKETVLGGFSERRAVGGDVIYQRNDNCCRNNCARYFSVRIK